MRQRDGETNKKKRDYGIFAELTDEYEPRDLEDRPEGVHYDRPEGLYYLERETTSL